MKKMNKITQARKFIRAQLEGDKGPSDQYYVVFQELDYGHISTLSGPFSNKEEAK